MITLIVKGPMKSALRAAQRRGINAKRQLHFKPGRKNREVKLVAACSTYRKVQDWMGEREVMATGRGLPPGSLLFFNARCD